jgi:hypothetical protein
MELKKLLFKPKSSELEPFQNHVCDELINCGPLGAETVTFMRDHKVRFKSSKQEHSGAAWSLSGNILLRKGDQLSPSKPVDPYLLSLVVHETRHLQQGFLVALSVYGELDAWQVGFRFYGSRLDAPLHPALQELLSLPLTWDRSLLRHAAHLMKVYSPGYRIHLLPLYPLHREIAWHITHKEPSRD